ncbi:hypothetical protein GQ55_2G104800 [Panicum hallii var. hallii]|uniref:Uncharacterized protein n=1 Tax=Panicum hallii var. hallii TaxID=1504633 RepID=A0A2T7ENJ8_9POAL|nr:hypothetical protein GQ55_2G104800 [Panicum hallii var. hallii]
MLFIRRKPRPAYMTRIDTHSYSIPQLNFARMTTRQQRRGKERRPADLQSRRWSLRRRRRRPRLGQRRGGSGSRAQGPPRMPRGSSAGARLPPAAGMLPPTCSTWCTPTSSRRFGHDGEEHSEAPRPPCSALRDGVPKVRRRAVQASGVHRRRRRGVLRPRHACTVLRNLMALEDMAARRRRPVTAEDATGRRASWTAAHVRAGPAGAPHA